MNWYNTSFGKAKSFSFTRHFNSCNNKDIGKGFAGKDFEPACPMESLKQTYDFAVRETGKSRFNSNTVYVSCLLRTWCTAVILYCTNKQHNVFTLKISPFLKEHRDKSLLGANPWWQTGNFPKELNFTMMKFIRFLNIMNYLKQTNEIEELKKLGSFEHWKPPTQIVIEVYGIDGQIVQNISNVEAKYVIEFVDTSTHLWRKDDPNELKPIFDKIKSNGTIDIYSSEVDDAYITTFIDEYHATKMEKCYKLHKNTEDYIRTSQFKYEVLDVSKRDAAKRLLTGTRRCFNTNANGIYDSANTINVTTLFADDEVHVVTHSKAMKHYATNNKGLFAAAEEEEDDDDEKGDEPAASTGEDVVKQLTEEKKSELFLNKKNIKSQNCGTIVVKQEFNKLFAKYIDGYANDKYFEALKIQKKKRIFESDDKYHKRVHLLDQSSQPDGFRDTDNIKIDKAYQYLCGSTDITVPLYNPFEQKNPTSIVTTTNLGGTKKRRSKQKRRTRRKKH